MDQLLLVDDDEVFVGVLAKSLRRRGYDVLVATNLSEAESILQRYTPAFAVIDLKLGSESGLALLPRLKQVNPSIATVVLTGYASIATAVETMKLGALDYLCKPVSVDDILAALQYRKPDPEQPIIAQPMSVERLEWEHIQKVLQQHQGNISATARSLGMHRRTLQRKLNKRPARL